jgi:hypothetical protein
VPARFSVEAQAIDGTRRVHARALVSERRHAWLADLRAAEWARHDVDRARDGLAAGHR